MQHRRTGVLIALCGSALALAAHLPAAERSARPDESTQPPAAAKAYFGVLGEVARPGVYEISAENGPFPESGSLRAGELVGRAGGLTGRYSGTLRVVRRFREGYRAFYTNRSDGRLRQGDVLIADAEASSIEAPAPERSSFVQLAFVNLLDRPIVVKLSQEDATIARIVSRLKQPAEIVETVQVFAPPGGNQRSIDPEAPLASASVVVFDRSVLDAAKIPQPPPAIPFSTSDTGSSNRASSEAPSTPAGPKLTVPIIEASGGRRPADPSEMNHPLHHRRPPSHANGPETAAESSALDAPAGPSDTAGPVLLGPSARPPALTQTAPPEEMDSEQGRAESRPPKGDLEASGPAPAREPSQIADSTAADDGGRLAVTPLMVATIVLCLVLAALIASKQWHRGKRPKRGARTGSSSSPKRLASQEPERAQQRLEEIINNELPIAVEPLRLPRVQVFHGRSGGAKQVRIDGAHEPASPHFDRPRHKPETVEAGAAAPVRDETGQTSASRHAEQQHPAAGRPHMLGAPATRSRQSRGSVLDRALSNLQREAAK